MSVTASPELFKAPRRMSTVEMVIEKIKELLVARHLKPGDKLPNEMELTRSLLASRGSIREAMKILDAFGILEIRRGDGTYVSTSASGTAIDHILFQLIMCDADKRKLRELRELIEVGITKIILANAAEEDIRAIEEQYQRMADMLERGERDRKVLTRCDIDFHRTLGRATHNELIEKIYDFTLELFAPSIEQTHSHAEAGALALRVHRQVLEGIRNHDPEQARAAIVESIKVWASLSTP